MKQKINHSQDEEKIVPVKKPRIKKNDVVESVPKKIATKKVVVKKEITQEKEVTVTNVTPKEVRSVHQTTVTTTRVSLKRQSKMMLKSVLLSKHFHMFIKLLIATLLVAFSMYGFYRYINHATENSVVVSQSEIIKRINKLTPLPEKEPLAVVRVEDPERLRKQNPFYENVKKGDYVVMYEDTGIIYDLLNNTIVSLKKVRAR